MLTATGLAALIGVGGVSAVTPAEAATDPVVSAGSLGVGEAIDFPGRTASTTLTLPVPDGLVPTALRGSVQVPVAFADGVVEVLQDGRVIGRDELSRGAAVLTPTDVPLDGVTVRDEVAVIEVRTTFVPVDQTWCHDPLDSVTTRLQDVSVEFAGEAGPPETLADVLPPVLENLTVVVPEDPGEDVVAAALDTVTTVAARYRDQAPSVEIVGATGEFTGDGDGVFTRRIEVTGTDGTDGAGISLESPGTPAARFVLHGTGDVLMDQVRLLGDDAARLLDSTSARAAAGEDVAVELPPSTQTVAELGNVGLSAEGIGRTVVSFGIDQGQLGRLSGQMQLHLFGSFTPPVATVGGGAGWSGGEVTVAVNGHILDRFTSGDGHGHSGVINRDIEVPDAVIDRYNDVTVTLTGGGAEGCGSAAPLTLRVNGDSTVTTGPVDSPTAMTTGFRALPQAAMPEIDVLLTRGDVADVNRAARILTAMQAVSPVRLRALPVEDPQDADAAVGSDRPLLVIDADGEFVRERPDAFDLPVSGHDGALEVEAADIDVTTAFGSLQTAWNGDNGRVVVVATSTARPDLLDRLVDSLVDGGVADLSGTAVVQQVDGAPQEIGVPDPAGSQPVDDARDNRDQGGGLSVIAILGIIGALVLAIGALLFALAVLGRSSRHRNGAAGSGQQGPA